MGENKKQRKGIASLLEQIETHEAKIARESTKPQPNEGRIHKWEKDIQIFEGEIAKKARKLPGGKK
jgi:peptidoglycan hydrolase CwlO-like protein